MFQITNFSVKLLDSHNRVCFLRIESTSPSSLILINTTKPYCFPHDPETPSETVGVFVILILTSITK